MHSLAFACSTGGRRVKTGRRTGPSQAKAKAYKKDDKDRLERDKKRNTGTTYTAHCIS